MLYFCSMNKKKDKNKDILTTQRSDSKIVVLPEQDRKNDNDTLAFEGGKFCLDVAKLVFAGVILAGIMKEEANTLLLYSTGVVVVVFFVVFGFYLIRKSKDNRR